MPVTSKYDYDTSLRLILGDEAIPDPPFYSLILAAVRKADSDNLERLRQGFPEVVAEFQARWNNPGGALDREEWEREYEAAWPGPDSTWEKD
jgi:hypothetical protein|tara:strand:- start:2714 stop:2989 length:276 start_codon:yes stop_codon:yes gene_type:complete